MSATSSTSDGLMYASKKDLLSAEQGVGTPRLAQRLKGRAGWRRGISGNIDEFVFIMTPGSDQYDWVEVGRHQQNVHNRRHCNREHYRNHPWLLNEKIRAKRRGPNIFIRYG